MQNGYSENITSSNNQNPTIIKKDAKAKDGQNKCPKCGSTDIELNVKSGKLRCNFCRYEFEPSKLRVMQENLSQLKGEIIGSGATDIVSDTNDLVTFKCSSCGSEVVVDTASSTQARCHWCRNTLSVNQQIPNGSIPDVVLPFGISKDEAKVEIEKFVGNRNFFAHPKFKKEFTTENIMGVYLPYMVVDANAHVNLVGNGEQLIRKYYKRRGDDRETYYDAELYHVEREFDLVIQGLTVESSADKLNNKSSNATNNVINSIMPFDLENCVKFNANYMKGYTSEKRDTNIEQLRPIVDQESKDIAKFAANDTLKQYDRGVAWKDENLEVKGQQWKSAYLPVWLYSYLQVKNGKNILHYVAVNARTKETMGSVPIHLPKLLGISFLVEILGVLAMILINLGFNHGFLFDLDRSFLLAFNHFFLFGFNFIFLLVGFLYFIIMFTRYRNSNARHKYETETKTKMSNLRKEDQFIKKEVGLTNGRINGANNTWISSLSISGNLMNLIVNQNSTSDLVDEKGKREND